MKRKKKNPNDTLSVQPDRFNAGEWEIVNADSLTQGRGYESQEEAEAALPSIKAQLSSK